MRWRAWPGKVSHMHVPFTFNGNKHSHSYRDRYYDAYRYPHFHSSRHSYAQTVANTKAASHPAAAPVTHDAVIRVYDFAGNVVAETHEHKGDFTVETIASHLLSVQC